MDIPSTPTYTPRSLPSSAIDDDFHSDFVDLDGVIAMQPDAAVKLVPSPDGGLGYTVK